MGKLTLLFSKVLADDNLNLSDEQYKILEEVYKTSSFKLTDKDENANSTSIETNVLNKDRLGFLKEIILNKFKKLNDEVYKYDNKFIITTSWFTHTKNGQFGNFHNHSNSMFSGVFYFTDNNSSIKFQNFNKNTSFNIIPKEYNVYNSLSWEIKPSKGTILLFPSEVYHYVNISNKDRKSLAFNIVPVGEYGGRDSKVNVKYA